MCVKYAQPPTPTHRPTDRPNDRGASKFGRLARSGQVYKYGTQPRAFATLNISLAMCCAREPNSAQIEELSMRVNLCCNDLPNERALKHDDVSEWFMQVHARILNEGAL